MRGLVLEGGGAKGAFHAGALKALFERGYTFDGVTGTSIGAVNGAMVAQGDFDLCLELWQSASPSMLFDCDNDMFIKLSKGEYDKTSLIYALKLLKKVVSGRGVSISKPLKLIEQYVDEDKLRQSSIDYGLVTVDITNKWMPVEVFKEDIAIGELSKYILASAYFPIFKRESLVGKKFFDGGIHDNLPINPLIRKGYDEIITIRTMSNLPGQKVIDGTVKVNHINPSEGLGRTFDFTPDKIAYNLEMGYYDALRFTDKLEGTKYYVKPFESSNLYNFLYNQPISVYKSWSQELNVKGTRVDIVNALFAFIRSNYGMGVLANEKTLFLELLEHYAMNLGIYRLKIYDKFEDFIEEIKETANKNTLMNDTKAEKLVNALLQINTNQTENKNEN